VSGCTHVCALSAFILLLMHHHMLPHSLRCKQTQWESAVVCQPPVQRVNHPVSCSTRLQQWPASTAVTPQPPLIIIVIVIIMIIIISSSSSSSSSSSLTSHTDIRATPLLLIPPFHISALHTTSLRTFRHLLLRVIRFIPILPALPLPLLRHD
jgi:hypothetical protein